MCPKIDVMENLKIFENFLETKHAQRIKRASFKLWQSLL
jgi:hypothetical protein